MPLATAPPRGSDGTDARGENAMRIVMLLFVVVLLASCRGVPLVPFI